MFFSMKRLTKNLAIKFGILLQNMESIIAEKTLPKFGNNSKNVRIDLPRKIINPDRIFLGNEVWIGPGSFLMALKRYPGPSLSNPEREQLIQTFDPMLVIGNRVTATGSLQITAVEKVTIEDDVMLASNILINDGLHGFENADVPYKYQGMSRVNPIVIRHGCWIGQNVVILPGVTIGELSIIGANSVVTKDVPDKSIAVGNPAKVIKVWDNSARKWIPV